MIAFNGVLKKNRIYFTEGHCILDITNTNKSPYFTFYLRAFADKNRTTGATSVPRQRLSPLSGASQPFVSGAAGRCVGANATAPDCRAR